MARIRIYNFARLNMVGHIPDKRQLIHDSVRTDEVAIHGKFRYGFFDATEFQLDGEDFAFGRLVKYKKLLEGEIVDEEEHELIEGGLPQGVIAKSRFFIHYRSGVVAYRPIKSRLSEKQFREITAEIINAANQDFFVNTILESVDEEFEIKEALRRFQILSRISFNVHPTNPSNRDEYRELDERLKNLEASRIQQVIEGGENGLNLDSVLGDEAYKGVIMAADGYGQASISGELEGRHTTINTSDSPYTAPVIFHEEPISDLEQLMPYFQRIWERMVE
ncbi:MAG: DUF4747 family protein [Chloroflexi bacterium]|nr:MAG: DUF4747 family protein [Chloroflexota bacterium]MBL1192716.1 DUF4747 family protein [Chloroflexota bacterium]NOH10009.1 DUF4747 family protein [Chloroflexota bacterium]